MMLGFDYVIGSQLASLSEFKKTFGAEQADGTWIIPVTYLAAWNSIGLGCDVVASWLAAPWLDKYGRKPLILFAAVVSVVGIVLQQLAPDWRVHLAGRAVNGSCPGEIQRRKLIDAVQVSPSVSCSPSRRCGLGKRAALSFGGFFFAFVSLLLV